MTDRGISRQNYEITICAIRLLLLLRTFVVFGKSIQFHFQKDTSQSSLVFSAGLFTPDEAFEYIVQMQIAKFEDPIMKCVDMVINELLGVIQESTSKVK